MRKLILAAQLSIVSVGISVGQASAIEIKPEVTLQADYATHEEDVRPLEDGGILRRAKFGLEGKINTNWSFEIEYDFSEDGEFDDAYVQYAGWKPGAIQAGQFKTPFGLERQSSSGDISFIERALPTDALAPSRRVGIGIGRAKKNYMFEVMGFGSSIEGDEGPGVGARFAYAPINTDSTLVHFGMATTSEEPDGEVNIRSDPESSPTDFRFVKTGKLDNVERINRMGLEFAWKSGPLSAQAEWMRADLERDAGNVDVNLEGWYVSGSWILTGGSRDYKGGRFRGVKANRNTGAWEVAARYSTVNLNDSDILGGQQRNTTLGLNWYAKDYVRLAANYIKVDSDRRGRSDDPSILLLSARFDF